MMNEPGNGFLKISLTFVCLIFDILWLAISAGFVIQLQSPITSAGVIITVAFMVVTWLFFNYLAILLWARIWNRFISVTAIRDFAESTFQPRSPVLTILCKVTARIGRNRPPGRISPDE